MKTLPHNTIFMTLLYQSLKNTVCCQFEMDHPNWTGKKKFLVVSIHFFFNYRLSSTQFILQILLQLLYITITTNKHVFLSTNMKERIIFCLLQKFLKILLIQFHVKAFIKVLKLIFLGLHLKYLLVVHLVFIL